GDKLFMPDVAYVSCVVNEGFKKKVLISQLIRTSPVIKGTRSGTTSTIFLEFPTPLKVLFISCLLFFILTTNIIKCIEMKKNCQ
ncbi:MAG: hypothetical protein WC265_04390, partial [Dysgonamonadaceae bacterium]